MEERGVGKGRRRVKEGSGADQGDYKADRWAFYWGWGGIRI